MISRRSFFTTLAAALVAPVFVRRVLNYVKPGRFTGTSILFRQRVFDQQVNDGMALLKHRLNDCYRVTRESMARNLYGFPGAREQAVVRLTDMADDRRYLTLRESLLEKSEHHFLRAQYWRIQGKPDYAMGSLHKAARAEDRARSLPS